MPEQPSAAWRRPDPDAPVPFPRADDPEATRTFSAADIAALRELLTEDAARHAALQKPLPAPRAARTKPPNLGSWLAMVVIVIVIAAAVLAGFALWLYQR